MKKWIYFVLLLVTQLGSNFAVAADYTDIPSIHPYYEAVDFVTDYGMMTELYAGGFVPGDLVTRGEAAQFLCATKNFVSKSIQSPFADLAAEEIFGKEAIDLAQNHVLDESELFFFRPYETITYGEALRWLLHAAGYRQEALASGGYPQGYLAAGAKRGLCRKLEALAPEQEINRGQMAQLLYNFCVQTGVYPTGGTVVGGSIDRDTVWKKENSPYIVERALTVIPGVRLKIEAGTQIILRDDMMVNGSLQAFGDEDDRIRINIYNGDGLLIKSGQSILHYCDIWDNQTKRIFTLHSDSRVLGCKFFSLKGVVLMGENQIFSNNEILRCEQGLQIRSNCAQIENNAVWGAQNGIWISGEGRDVGITRCRIWENNNGIWAAGKTRIAYCTIENNDTGVTIGQDYNGALMYSQIRGNAVGILNSGCQNAQISGCNIFYNTVNAVNQSAYDISLTDNYWGSVREQDIYETITDGWDNAGYGRIAITPFLQERYDEGDVKVDQEGGIFQEFVTVSLTAVGEDYDIYYTTDGSDPKNQGICYETPLTFCSDTVLKAAAVKQGKWGRVAQYEYRIEPEHNWPYTVKNVILYDNNGKLLIFPDQTEVFSVQADVVENYEDTRSEAAAVLAVYDEKSRLVSCKTAIADDCGEIFFTVKLPQGQQAAELRLFLWDSMDNMAPVSSMLKLNQNLLKNTFPYF